MLWVLFSFLTAFFESMKDITSKKSLKGIDEYVVAWSYWAFSMVFLLPILLFTGMPEVLGNDFLFALTVGGSLNAVGAVLYMRAIKISDLSITIPMITFTPLFLLITSPLILNEFPSPAGMTGIFLIVFGSYVLNLQATRKKRPGLLSPFTSMAKEKGPILMLLVAFIWSIAANFDKIGVVNSSPAFWNVSLGIVSASLITPVMLLKSRNSLRQINANKGGLLPVGLFSALTVTFQMTAITMTIVPYLISIKRTSAVMSVVLGALIFKEKNLRQRLGGTILMVLGVVLIALF